MDLLTNFFRLMFGIYFNSLKISWYLLRYPCDPASQHRRIWWLPMLLLVDLPASHRVLKLRKCHGGVETCDLKSEWDWNVLNLQQHQQMWCCIFLDALQWLVLLRFRLCWPYWLWQRNLSWFLALPKPQMTKITISIGLLLRFIRDGSCRTETKILTSGVHKPTFEPDRMQSGKYPLAEHFHQRRDDGGIWWCCEHDVILNVVRTFMILWHVHDYAMM